MIPIRFGMPGRQLFGLYRSPSGGADRGESVLFCNPFGQEAIRSHRLFRVLADRLSQNGFHVLRFDYFGTGDSDGEDSEGNIECWVDDVLTANQEVVRRSGCARCSWFGLRLGASLAAMATAKVSQSVNQLILWDPVIDGSSYLAELAAAHVLAFREAYGARWEIESELRDAVLLETHTEALGFPLTVELRRQLDGMTAASFAATKASTVTLYFGHARHRAAELEKQLAARGIRLDAKTIESEISWASNEAMNSSIVPVDILRGVVASLLEEK